MNICVIEPSENIATVLRAAGYEVSCYAPNAVPSITGLILQEARADVLVIQDLDTPPWSTAHILSAAQICGTAFVVGNRKVTAEAQLSTAVCFVGTVEELLQALRRPKSATTAGGRSLLVTDSIAPVAVAAQTVSVKPLKRIPPDRILMLGVIGSQSRIGCTTQAIGLWGYLKRLGFTPAILAPAAQISAMASVMDCQEFDGGCVIDGIPFVTSSALAYDCYVFDYGMDALPEGLRLADIVVLVAGAKPWELSNTAAAIRALIGIDSKAALLSFTNEENAATLKPLFGNTSVAVAPWIPNPWEVSDQHLAVYDGLLRGLIVQSLAAEPALERQSEQSIKEE